MTANNGIWQVVFKNTSIAFYIAADSWQHAAEIAESYKKEKGDIRTMVYVGPCLIEKPSKPEGEYRGSVEDSMQTEKP